MVRVWCREGVLGGGSGAEGKLVWSGSGAERELVTSGGGDRELGSRVWCREGVRGVWSWRRGAEMVVNRNDQLRAGWGCGEMCGSGRHHTSDAVVCIGATQTDLYLLVLVLLSNYCL